MTGGGSGIGAGDAHGWRPRDSRWPCCDLDGEAAGARPVTTGRHAAADVADADAVGAAFSAQVVESSAASTCWSTTPGITGRRRRRSATRRRWRSGTGCSTMNARGAFLCSRAALPTMLAQGRARHHDRVDGRARSPSRAARLHRLEGRGADVAKSLAVDYAPRGIRSNAVCPGFVRTPMTQWRLDVPELRGEVEAAHPDRAGGRARRRSPMPSRPAGVGTAWAT